VWLLDILIGSYPAAQHHGQPAPRKILNAGHVIDVVHQPR